MSDAELKWEGREDCECGEHTTTNDRTWCLEDKEWCYPDAPCRGCELPVLRAEVERLRGVVEAARAESAFEAWWNSDIPTPPMPEIDLYPTSPFTPRRIYFGPNNRGTAWAAWQAALADLEAKP